MSKRMGSCLGVAYGRGGFWFRTCSWTDRRWIDILSLSSGVNFVGYVFIFCTNEVLDEVNVFDYVAEVCALRNLDDILWLLWTMGHVYQVM